MQAKTKKSPKSVIGAGYRSAHKGLLFISHVTKVVYYWNGTSCICVDAALNVFRKVGEKYFDYDLQHNDAIFESAYVNFNPKKPKSHELVINSTFFTILYKI